MTGFIESLVYVTVVLLVNLFYDESKFLGFALYNKTLASIYVIWLSFLLYYILVITSKDIVKTRKNTPRVLRFWAVLFSIIIFILPIDLFYDPQLHLSNSSGSAINFLGLVCLLYLFMMFVIVIKNYNNKNLKGKFVPIYFLLVVLSIVVVIGVNKIIEKKDSEKVLNALDPSQMVVKIVHDEIMNLFTDLNKQGITIVLVTHEDDVAD